MSENNDGKSLIAVKEAQLNDPINGTVYCEVSSGSASERTNYIMGAEGSTILIFNALVPLELQGTRIKSGIYQSTGGFKDILLGECNFDVDDNESNGVYELTSYDPDTKETVVTGILNISVEKTSFMRGKTFKKAKEFISAADVSELNEANISSSSSKKSVKNVVKEIMLTSATEADLSGLGLDSLPPELSQIGMITKVLDMGFNHFTTYPDVTFMGFQFLEEFTLTGNRLKSLTPAISKLSNLLSFNLNGNQLQELPPELGQIVTLEKLDLSNNQLDYIIPEIGYLTNLQDWLLGGNKITQLPRSIGRCVNMEVMDLSCCELMQLPNEFTRMTTLMELNLGKNQLTVLPSNLGRMTRLVTLNVADNMITDLPLSIGYCQGLVQCYLDRNPIQDQKMLEASKRGVDHLVDYLETRMLSYMSDRGINPQKLQMQMEQQELNEKNRAVNQQRMAEEEEERRMAEEQERLRYEEELQKREILAQSTPQEQSIVAKLNQAKNMGIVILNDCANRIANLEMFVGQVTNIRGGLPFSRAVEGLTPDVEALQRVIGYQREPAIPNIAVGFASPQLQNFKHGLLIKLAHALVCIRASAPYLQNCQDAKSIVEVVKISRVMNFKLSNIV